MKPENYSFFFKLEKQKEKVIDRNRTRTFQDGQDELGLQTTNLKQLG